MIERLLNDSRQVIIECLLNVSVGGWTTLGCWRCIWAADYFWYSIAVSRRCWWWLKTEFEWTWCRLLSIHPNLGSAHWNCVVRCDSQSDERMAVSIFYGRGDGVWDLVRRLVDVVVPYGIVKSSVWGERLILTSVLCFFHYVCFEWNRLRA